MMTIRKLVTLSALLLVAGVAHAAPPSTFTYSGFLLDSAGSPVAGPASMTFKLYDAATAGTTVYTETISGIVPGADGFFSVIIGLQTTIPTDAFQNARYLGVTFGTEAEMSPRIALSSVPSAFTALTAASATSVDWTGIANRPTSSCSGATPFVTGIGANGAVTCGAVPSGSAGCLSGQILKYVGTAWVCAADDAGASLTGVAPLSVSGSAISMSAAGLVTPGYLTSTAYAAFAAKQERVSGTCGPGQYITAIDAAGGVTCGTDLSGASALTGVVAGAGLSGGGTTGNVSLAIAAAGVDGTMLAPGAVGATHILDGSITLAKLGFSCLDGEVLKWNAGLVAWVCAVDSSGSGTVTAVHTSGGLTVDGVAGASITGAGTLGIDTNAIQARVSGSCPLGAYVTGVNADGSVSCSPDANSGGTLTGIWAGTGLLADGFAGGLITGLGTLSADPTVLQARVNGFCGVGQFISQVWGDGSVSCGWYTAGQGLAMSPSGTGLYIPTGSLSEQFLFTPQAGVVASATDVVVRSHYIDSAYMNGHDRATVRIAVNGGMVGGSGVATVSWTGGSETITLFASGARPWTYATSEITLPIGSTAIDVSVRADDPLNPVIIRDLQLDTRASAVTTSSIYSTGAISSGTISAMWISPQLIVNNASSGATINRYFNAVNLTHTVAGTGYFMLPLAGIPESVYGAPVTLVDVTVYFTAPAVAPITNTVIWRDGASVVSDATAKTGTGSYTVTPPANTLATGAFHLGFTVSYSAGATTSIDRVRVRYRY